MEFNPDSFNFLDSDKESKKDKKDSKKKKKSAENIGSFIIESKPKSDKKEAQPKENQDTSKDKKTKSEAENHPKPERQKSKDDSKNESETPEELNYHIKIARQLAQLRRRELNQQTTPEDNIPEENTTEKEAVDAYLALVAENGDINDAEQQVRDQFNLDNSKDKIPFENNAQELSELNARQNEIDEEIEHIEHGAESNTSEQIEEPLDIDQAEKTENNSTPESNNNNHIDPEILFHLNDQENSNDNNREEDIPLIDNNSKNNNFNNQQIIDRAIIYNNFHESFDSSTANNFEQTTLNSQPTSPNRNFNQPLNEKSFLVDGILGYVIGRHQGRKKAEQKLIPKQKKLEKEVQTLRTKLLEREHIIRQAVIRQKIDPRETIKRQQIKREQLTRETIKRQPLTREPIKREQLVSPNIIAKNEKQAPPKVSIETIGRTIVNAQTEIKTYNNKTEVMTAIRTPSPEKKAQSMNRKELMALSEKIVVDGASLRQIYESRSISDRGLRRLITVYLKGGNVKRSLQQELIEKEIDFERDPLLRDRGHSLAEHDQESQQSSHLGPSLLAGTVAAVSAMGGVSVNNVISPKDIKSTVKNNLNSQSQVPKTPHRVADISLIVIIAILISLIIILSIYKNYSI